MCRGCRSACSRSFPTRRRSSSSSASSRCSYQSFPVHDLVVVIDDRLHDVDLVVGIVELHAAFVDHALVDALAKGKLALDADQLLVVRVLDHVKALKIARTNSAASVMGQNSTSIQATNTTARAAAMTVLTRCVMPALLLSHR